MDELKNASEGSAECKMNNLSLARIMYGTSEDFRATTALRIPGYSSLARPVSATGFSRVEAVSVSETLSGLLQKAWAALSHKS
jgi:peroxiredoxin